MPDELQIFWRPPLTSSCRFYTKDLQRPMGLAVDRAEPPVLQVAGWIRGTLLEPADAATTGLRRQVGDEVERESRTPDEVASFDAGEGGLVRWTGLVTLDPGSRVRLTGPSDFRLTWGRARRALVGAVLADASVRPGQCESLSHWFEVTCEPLRKAPISAPAVVEVCGPKKGAVNSTWSPLLRQQLCGPEAWSLVHAPEAPWVTCHGVPCEMPEAWRSPPHGLLAGEGPVPRPVLSILVVMPAVPPEAGVGCMTPNWTLVAALEEAMYRALGARYQLFVVPISQEEQLGRLDPAAVKSLLDRAEVQGAVYLLSPQRVAGEFRTKHDLVHDVPLFQLMERLEGAGVPTLWPHPSHLYRTLAGKEWPTHLCLSSQYHIPSTTRVSRQAVLASPKLAAQDAWHALKKLIEAQGRTPPEQVHAAVKVGYSWRSAGVTLCHGLVELANTLLEVARGGEHSSFMVQELIDGILCEAMVYVLHGQMVAHPQYYRFPEHKAPPQYLHRKAAKEILGGETALAHCEEVMKKIVEHWILWASAQCATPIPFLRIDFLLSVAAPGSAPLAVWTGEVSELGVAVELQGLHGHESRELVMDTLMASVLRGHGHPPSKVGDAGGTHSSKDSL
ncbi:unnamed protein product [Durusdinium trenchii]|uniref:Uncharacterized protein n=1 Tax=Durusdinium trenchii TaxID=1381693 RepID=A0ABP0J4D2_9DINO